MNPPNYQTVSLPFDEKQDKKDAAAFLSELVQQGLGFQSEVKNGMLVVSFSGGF
jgi:hypothetical protein